MSDATGGADGSAPAAAAGDDAPREIQVNAQYVKDLSFENPNAPEVLSRDAPDPQIEVSIDIDANNLGDNRYEVELRIVARGTRDGERAFIVDLLYAALFTLVNIDEEAIRPICLIEGPRLMFPFARRIIADCTRDGGFAPLMLDPIDFAALFLSRADNAQAETA